MGNAETYMQRCFQLARKGMGHVSPNPLVGCVIVKNDEIIGEGYHREIGGNHAEVNAIDSVKDKSLLEGAELYVNLEPCTHHGKTPPCADRILESGISKVYISGLDVSEKVNGLGIEKLQSGNIEVVSDVLNERELELNRRFRTFHRKKRPYIILKWAKSKDGFMDRIREEGDTGQFRISNEASQRLSHKWRSEEDAIMIGTNTAINDDPSLTVRLIEGNNPLRIVIDMNSRLPSNLKLLNDGEKTIVYSSSDSAVSGMVEFVHVKKENVISQILADLHKREIQSVIVEGGKKLLMSFLNPGMWDEIRIFRSENEISKGLRSPDLDLKPVSKTVLDGNTLLIYKAAE